MFKLEVIILKKLVFIVLLSFLALLTACGQEVKKSIEISNVKEHIDIGESFKIKCTTNPVDEKKIYESSDPKVATIDVTGIVKGINQGTVTITVKLASDNKVTSSFQLKVGYSFSELDLSDISYDEELWNIKEIEKDTDEETIYMLLRRKVTEVARGTETNTSFSFSDVKIKDMGTIDQSIQRVVGLIWLTCPFDLYWYQEQSGFNYSVKITSSNTINLSIKLPVSTDYQKSLYEVDLEKKVTAIRALKNADKIAAEANGSDYDKIRYFKKTICSLVTYDNASNNNQIAGRTKAGNNPWQMVSVFDNVSTTNVVCAGYSKAFKYLCDKVGIECKVVNGVAFGGAHVWNVVTIDGNNYIVDVTNCDTSFGSNDRFLLVGATGNIYDGYLVEETNTSYRYYTSRDSGVTDMVFIFGEDGLKIAESAYRK